MQTQKLVQLQPIKKQFDIKTSTGRTQLSKQIKADIDEYCKLAYDDGPRSHLGASEIGHKCERYLWYKFRWWFREEFSGRMLRLFNRGHKEEERYEEWIRGVGGEILDKSTTKDQTRMVAIAGHFGGLRDGTTILSRYGIGETLLLEFKTNSTGKAFSELLQDGIKEVKPVHWAQICTYGYGWNIKYCLYLNINKNDDDLHVELVELDLEHGKSLIDKAQRIISAPLPPKKISENPSWYECNYCAAKQVCHFNAEPLHNCRSCLHSEPGEDGQWNCDKWKSIIPTEVIAVGCEQWIKNVL